MKHYHIFFNLKTNDDYSLHEVKNYLNSMVSEKVCEAFELSVKDTEVFSSPFYKYHVIIKFKDALSINSAFNKIRRNGIKTGQHGRIVNLVKDFHFEFYEAL